MTDGGMERWDRQGPRAAGKRSEEERVKCEATEDGLCWGPWGHVASRGASRAPAGLRRGRVSGRPSRPSLVSPMPQEEAHVFD